MLPLCLPLPARASQHYDWLVLLPGRAGVVGVGAREAGAPARQEEPRRRGAQPLREGGCVATSPGLASSRLLGY